MNAGHQRRSPAFVSDARFASQATAHHHHAGVVGSGRSAAKRRQAAVKTSRFEGVSGWYCGRELAGLSVARRQRTEHLKQECDSEKAATDGRSDLHSDRECGGKDFTK